MAGLAAAFDLARTKALQDQFDVTIYQLGWRLERQAGRERPVARRADRGAWPACLVRLLRKRI